MAMGRTVDETGCSFFMERDNLSYRSKLIYRQGLIGWPGDQALGDTIGKLNIRKDVYMHLFEGLLPFSGMFFP